MAIIDLINPSTYSSAHDDLWHIAESDNTAYIDFKYVFDIYCNNVQLIRAKVYPNPSNLKGYFNASNIVSNTMKFDWLNFTNDFLVHSLNDSGEITQDYTIQVGEEYNGTTFINLDSGVVTVANQIENLLSRFVPSSVRPGNTIPKFLTNRDRVNKTASDEMFYIGVLLPGIIEEEDLPNYIRIRQYNSSNTFLSSGVLTNAIAIGSNTNIHQINIAPLGINDCGISINSNTEYYDIELMQWQSESTYRVTDTMRLYLDCKRKYDTFNIHFLNNYGVFDTARFNLASRLSMDAERKSFEQPDYRLGNSVTYYTGTTLRQYNETKINFGSKYQWTYKLTMDFPTDIDYEWLDELLMSPQVWLQIKVAGGFEFYPVGIKATNYEYSKHINNRLRAFEIEVDMNQKRNGFRR